MDPSHFSRATRTQKAIEAGAITVMKMTKVITFNAVYTLGGGRQHGKH